MFGGRGCFAAGPNAGPDAAGQDLGYDVVIIGQSHGGTRNGLVPDSFFCGGAGHDYDEQAPAICIGHRTMHLMFNDPPEFSGSEGGDIPLGARGEEYLATTVFDGWGYVQLHDARDPNLRIIDSYAVPEALDEGFSQGHGVLSVHEVETTRARTRTWRTCLPTTPARAWSSSASGGTSSRRAF